MIKLFVEFKEKMTSACPIVVKSPGAYRVMF